MRRPKYNTTILAVCIPLLIALVLVLGKGELAVYMAISLLGLLAYMVRSSFGKPDDRGG
jgi:hypothetical protein